jgi:hypothetical protein
MVVVAKLACARRSREDSANLAQCEPKPCERFAKWMLLNANVIAHLADCEGYKGVVAHLKRESDLPKSAYRLHDELHTFSESNIAGCRNHE